jgi:hypothetical protein
VDCIKGRRDQSAPHRVLQRGCELALFLPSKVGNLDCTLCLDCVQACPHDNIALATRLPGLELVDPRRRSGIGRLSRRPDIVALVVVFVFGGLLNAFGMVAPAHTLGQWLARAVGLDSEALVLAMFFVVALVVAPVLILGGAAALTTTLTAGSAIVTRTRSTSDSERQTPDRLPGDRRSVVGVARWAATSASYTYALIPLGVGIWLSHYGFHLLTGALTVVPVTQSAVMDLVGWAAVGAPRWRWTGMRPGLVFPLELGVILLGAIGSLGLVYLISERDHPERPVLAAIPWALVTFVLAAAAIWVLSQPMEMRGIGFAG